MTRTSSERPTPALERLTDGGVQSIELLDERALREDEHVADEVVRARVKVGPPSEVDLALAPEELGRAVMLDLTQAAPPDLEPESEEGAALGEDELGLEAAMEALDEALAEEAEAEREACETALARSVLPEHARDEGADLD
jgi:hypothetical protein